MIASSWQTGHRLGSRSREITPDRPVFSFWRCDKKNHGWREDPPLTVPCQSFDLPPGLHPPVKVSFERKTNTAFHRSPRSLTHDIGRLFCPNYRSAEASSGCAVGYS